MDRRRALPRKFALGIFAIAALGALATSSLACGSSVAYDYKREPDPRRHEYVIGPLDRLSVAVWKNQELSGEVPVRPDGIITLPLIGAVNAAGRTPTDLQGEIAKRYGEFLRAEEIVVSVGIVAVNSYSFTVTGNVEHAGVFTSANYLTAIDALAMAGGPNRFAGDRVYIVRGSPSRRIPIDIGRATSGDHPEENLVVLRGDILLVP